MGHPIIGGIYLRSEVYVALVNRTGEACYGDKSEEILSALVLKWLAGSAADPEARAGNEGYQWKQVFLPHGTELRTSFQGRSTYAKVENENIICNGASITPSQFANAKGCGTRNAWKTIWLKFPGTSKWELAAHCRDA